jgi:hypothetical protein
LLQCFLLAGIAGLLSVMAGRLARIIDRGRAFLREVHLAMQTVRIALHEGKSSSKSVS